MDREYILAPIDDSESIGAMQSLGDPYPGAYMRGFRAAQILAKAAVNRAFDAEKTEVVATEHKTQRQGKRFVGWDSV